MQSLRCISHTQAPRLAAGTQVLLPQMTQKSQASTSQDLQALLQHVLCPEQTHSRTQAEPHGAAQQTPLLQALLGRAGISEFRLLGSLRPQPLGKEPLQALSHSPPPLQTLPRVTAQPPSISQLFHSPSSALQPLPCLLSRKRAFTSPLHSAGFSVLLTIMFLLCF